MREINPAACSYAAFLMERCGHPAKTPEGQRRRIAGDTMTAITPPFETTATAAYVFAEASGCLRAGDMILVDQTAEICDGDRAVIRLADGVQLPAAVCIANGRYILYPFAGGLIMPEKKPDLLGKIVGIVYA